MTLEVRPTYLTRAQLGAELQVSAKTIQRWEREGMPAEVWGARLRRYDLGAVRAWMARVGLGGLADVPARPAKVSRHGAVYVIQAGSGGAIKIGWVSHQRLVGERLSALQTGNAAELRLLASFPGTWADEQALHRRFVEDRVRGEWFAPTKDVLGFAIAHSEVPER